MKKIILIGSTACGKTTISQYINHQELRYIKTQTVQVCSETIDTPGEYLENRAFFSSLMVSSYEADLVLFVQDASREQFYFSPGQAGAFSQPVAGVVTKIDIAAPQEIRDARERLELAGADPVFEVSAVTGEGMDKLLEFLQ
ncbi:MAG: EutP/PduV family microcompartment system protein [Lachnospiraceae bacterium]|jgi:ethanolamine utilization protein EutP